MVSHNEPDRGKVRIFVPSATVCDLTAFDVHDEDLNRIRDVCVAHVVVHPARDEGPPCPAPANCFARSDFNASV